MFTILRATNDYETDTHITSEYMSLSNNGIEYDVYFKMLFRYKNNCFVLDEIYNITAQKRFHSDRYENVIDTIEYNQIVTFVTQHFFQKT